MSTGKRRTMLKQGRTREPGASRLNRRKKGEKGTFSGGRSEKEFIMASSPSKECSDIVRPAGPGNHLPPLKGVDETSVCTCGEEPTSTTDVARV